MADGSVPAICELSHSVLHVPLLGFYDHDDGGVRRCAADNEH